MPLKVGHRLVYKLTDPDGVETGVTQVVSDTLEINGYPYAIVLTTFSDGLIVNDPMYYREDASGTYTLDGGETGETWILPSPLRPDTEWTTQSKGWVYRNRTTSGADVEVSGRTYHDCLVLDAESRSPRGRHSHSTSWYSPGIGMVKMVGSGDDQFVWTLVRHSDSL